MAEYHSNDFNLLQWISEANKISLPNIIDYSNDKDTLNDKTSKDWNEFYNNHKSGNFFKPRRYLALEFSKYLSSQNVKNVIEVGCGYGCSMFPLLEKFEFKYIATDFSKEALQILSANPKFDLSRCLITVWDIAEPAPELLFDYSVQAILCVFALSAVHPDFHVLCLKNMRALLLNRNIKQKSNEIDSISLESEPCDDVKCNQNVILFRDYGIHDMTMYRHNTRYSETLYRRADGTLSYYFDLPYLRDIAALAGLSILELEYATVRVSNRKTENVMHRVFVHAVFAVNEE